MYVAKSVKRLAIALCIVLGVLEYKFWFGADSIIKVHKLRSAIKAQDQELGKLQLRNQQLAAKIENLKAYPMSIEEQARYELGMVKQGEKYYQVVEPIL